MSWERVEKRQDFEPIEPNIREEALKLRVTVVNSTMMRKQLDCIDQCIVEHGEGRIFFQNKIMKPDNLEILLKNGNL